MGIFFMFYTEYCIYWPVIFYHLYLGLLRFQITPAITIKSFGYCESEHTLVRNPRRIRSIFFQIQKFKMIHHKRRLWTVDNIQKFYQENIINTAQKLQMLTDQIMFNKP